MFLVSKCFFSPLAWRHFLLVGVLVHCTGGSTTNPAPPPFRDAVRPGDTHGAGGPTTDPAPCIPSFGVFMSAERSAVTSNFSAAFVTTPDGSVLTGSPCNILC